MLRPFILVAGSFCAAGASAQSSLTVFGVVDAGISRYSTKSSTYGSAALFGPRTMRQSQTVLSPSGLSSSRLGFRGTEDLGGGLAASFWLEAPLSNDTGGGISNFGRRSTLSLSGPFGELRLGRDYTASFWNDAVFDPMTVNGVGTNLIAVVNSNIAASRALATGGLLNGGLSAGTDSYLRTSNAVSYFLPPNLGGFYGQVQYALPENIKVEGASAPDGTGRRGRYAGARAGWSNGAVDVALAYGESTVADTLLNKERIKTVNLGASYDFGWAKLFGELSRVKDVKERPLTAAVSGRYDGALLGLTVPVGPGLIRVSYATVKFDNGSTVPDADARTNKLAVGYVHHLSKRTALYASVARIRIRDGHNNPTVMGVTPLVLSLPAIFPQPGFTTSGGFQPRGAMGYDVGIRHTF
ncbi:putative outer membrane porin, OmpC family [Variovorax paradoxus B4]|uniref:Putative outer membrane porin, OmpC family n=1 Tax=Variovorax paradoxus B4 TaxID=1246301 RepID=T1X9C4_VARPD|nr:porin [Variovorax paradoxus]AGU49133.1 putative outer membrane porin, OmpC family [Variovorax paradoxus B4]